MLEAGSGKIINIVSLLSFQGGIRVPAYAAAKSGVAAITRALANEWAGRGVNVNAIAPGYMSTANTAALRADAVRSRQILERIPDGRRLAAPSERIVIRSCRMRAGHGGVTIGSEVSGGVRDVFAEGNTMSSPDLERGLRIKTNLARGGVVENVFMRDTEIGEVGSAVDIEMDYQQKTEDLSQPFVPVVRNILVKRLTVSRAALALSIVGLESSPVSGLVVRDSVFRNVVRGSRFVWAGPVLLENVTLAPAPAATPARAPAPSPVPSP